jgi:CheY-like chemotaxis protein
LEDKKKVLIIDDDIAILESVSAILEGNGYVTVKAISGEEGFQAYRSENPDIVICDMMMEHVDEGAKVARKIREKDKDLPLFLLSSIGDATVNTIGLGNLGFNGVFQKPIHSDIMLSVIGKFTG